MVESKCERHPLYYGSMDFNPSLLIIIKSPGHLAVLVKQLMAIKILPAPATPGQHQAENQRLNSPSKNLYQGFKNINQCRAAFSAFPNSLAAPLSLLSISSSSPAGGIGL